MELLLEPTAVRVLGSLVEKEITTPEYYPMTLNSLTAACNQKTNRDPVMSCQEETVESALENLRHKGLVTVRTGPGLRVPKYGHRLAEQVNLGRREVALLCVLMLRGQQTAGELRDRTERMHGFADLAEVELCLQHLMDWQPQPLVTRLPRQPGTKEPRYAHLLSGEVPLRSEPASVDAGNSRPLASNSDRVLALEEELRSLRAEFDALRNDFDEFRKQFG